MLFGTILVAEDDKMIQKILVRMMKRSGYDGVVHVFEDAESALECAQEHNGDLDLILIDTGLHHSGDQAFFNALRALAPTTPIVASSGYSEEILQSDKHFRGCDLAHILCKPFGLKEIKALLSSLNLN
jgi:DNA-binding response OmpR family regulator